MSRKIAYWGATGLVGIVTLLAAFSYLTRPPRRSRIFGTWDIPSSCVSCSASGSWQEPSCCSCHGCRR